MGNEMVGGSGQITTHIHRKRMQIFEFNLSQLHFRTSELKSSLLLMLSPRNPFFLPISARRRVHISEATLKCLNDAYEVEPGNGGSRDNHLKMLNVKTFLIKRTEPLR